MCITARKQLVYDIDAQTDKSYPAFLIHNMLNLFHLDQRNQNITTASVIILEYVLPDDKHVLPQK